MKMFNITGWKDIYCFTFAQTIKNTSYKVALIILCILAAAAMPVAALINSPDKENTTDNNSSIVTNDTEDVTEESDTENIKLEISEVDTIYVCYDESDKNLSNVMTEWQDSYICEFVKADTSTIEEKRKDINTDNTYALLSIFNVDGLYNIDITFGWETMDHTESVDSSLVDLAARLERLQIENITPGVEVPEEQFAAVSGYVGESDQEYNKGLNTINYMIQLGYVLIFIFILSFSGESIASSVVSEKAGKMVEFLMITVKPMAILVGKILAVLSSVFILFFAMIGSGIISAVICNIVNGNMVSKFLSSVSETINESQNTLNFNPLTILILLLFIFGGLMFYALIASLCGAAVSKIEELSEGIVLFTFTLIVGSYMAIGVAVKIFSGTYAGEPGAYEMLTYMLPISSPFSVPQNLITGYAGYGTALISLLILYAVVFFMIVLSSKVYEYMLFYNGAKLKVKDIIHIALHGKIKGAK